MWGDVFGDLKIFEAVQCAMPCPSHVSFPPLFPPCGCFLTCDEFQDDDYAEADRFEKFAREMKDLESRDQTHIDWYC